MDVPVHNAEFTVHMLNSGEIEKANNVALVFDRALEELKKLCPEGRYLSLVKTKMEEASFFAKRAMACDPVNQRVNSCPPPA